MIDLKFVREHPDLVREAVRKKHEKGDVDAIRAAIADGADPDARGDGGRTALLVAARAGHLAAFQAVLDAGADVDLQDDDRANPFLWAGAEGRLDILRLANEAGADPAITNRYGGVALIPASERGHVETVRYLLEVHGATQAGVELEGVGLAEPLDEGAQEGSRCSHALLGSPG